MLFEENFGLGVVVNHALIHETVKSEVDKLKRGQPAGLNNRKGSCPSLVGGDTGTYALRVKAIGIF